MTQYVLLRALASREQSAEERRRRHRLRTPALHSIPSRFSENLLEEMSVHLSRRSSSIKGCPCIYNHFAGVINQPSSQTMLLFAACATLLIASPTLASTIPVESSFSCPPAAPNGLVYRSSCYDFDGVEKTWTDARSTCRNRGGRLAMVPDVDVQNWLSSTAATKFPSRQGVWLGLHDRTNEGTFYWDNYDGRDIVATYFNWAAGEPNNMLGAQDCAYMRRSYQWRWVDIECSLATIRVYSSICEFNALPPRVLPTSTRQTAVSLSTITARLTTPGERTASTRQTAASLSTITTKLPTTSERTTVSLTGMQPEQLPSSTQRPSVQPSSFAPTAIPSQLDLASTASIDVMHPDMVDYGNDLSAANAAAARSHPDQEAQYSQQSNGTVYIVLGVIALLACTAALAVLIMCRRRRLRRRAKCDEEPPVSYSSAGVRGMENPLYCSLAQPTADALTAELRMPAGGDASAAQPLLGAAVGREAQATSASCNEYVDVESLPGGCGWRVGCDADRTQSLGHIYAEPLPTMLRCRSPGDTLERPERSKESTPPIDAAFPVGHVYAECGPPSTPESQRLHRPSCERRPSPLAAAEAAVAGSELNDLSKDGDGTAARATAADRQLFGCLQLNVDDECEESGDGGGGYERYTSQWQPYENVSKPS